MDADLTNETPSNVHFICPACGFTKDFQAQHAGRKIKCKCGNLGVVPPLPAKAPKSADDDGEFDLVPLAPSGARNATATAKMPASDDRKLARCQQCGGMFVSSRLHNNDGMALCAECLETETARKQRAPL